ncbi:MAG: hypothetical protein ABIX01_01095 [Chitinophagaceae bacterium]
MKTKNLLLSILIFACAFANAQNVGINTTGAAPNPTALLHVDAVASISKGFLITGDATLGFGFVPDLGAGSRLMFYPAKSAFRAGFVDGIQWNNANVGAFSTAIGYNTTANGFYSTAMGYKTIAAGNYSTAMGWSTTAGGLYSTAMGCSTTASGSGSTAMGSGTTASGLYSTAMGWGSIASGAIATAMGVFTTANGDYSTAMGSNVSTNGHVGSFVVGDFSTNTVFNSGTDNRFTARFDGGYRFYTTSDLSSSCILASGSNAWSTSSSVYLKENFEDVNGEDYLKKLMAFILQAGIIKSRIQKLFAITDQWPKIFMQPLEKISTVQLVMIPALTRQIF